MDGIKVMPEGDDGAGKRELKRSKKEEGRKIARRIGIYCLGASCASLLFVPDPKDINYE